MAKYKLVVTDYDTDVAEFAGESLAACIRDVFAEAVDVPEQSPPSTILFVLEGLKELVEQLEDDETLDSYVANCGDLMSGLPMKLTLHVDQSVCRESDAA